LEGCSTNDLRISDVAFLYEAFGIDQGRLISEYPRKRKWTQVARQLISQHARDESERSALIELLIALEKRALYDRQSATWDDNKGWTENAVDEHARRQFRAILNHKPTAQTDVTTIADIWKVAPWKNPPSLSIARNARQMVDTALPLIHLSKTLVLIDRNFEPADARFSKVLIEFAKRLLTQAHAPKISQIKYVTTHEDSNNRTVKLFENECRTILQSRMPLGISVKFVLKAKRLLHDRFVLTDRGCLQYGIGLDEGDGDVLVTRLSNDNFMDEWDKWEQNSCHNFVIEGSGQ
jgi:hypothetical protein